ncbi:MAG: Ig-like domain-containing protein [Candidatus Thermoplasmatota archaeon]|nr:Ig-like domain-containing protein [Candidatus Thermoplasmatota archaeon]
MEPDRQKRSVAQAWSLLLLFFFIMPSVVLIPLSSEGDPHEDDVDPYLQEEGLPSRSEAYSAHVEVFMDPEKFVISNKGSHSIDLRFEEYCGTSATITRIEADLFDPFGELVLDLPDRNLNGFDVPAAGSNTYNYLIYISKQKFNDLRGLGLTRLELHVKTTCKSFSGGIFTLDQVFPAEIGSRIALIVNSELYDGIKDNLDRYQKDIKDQFSATFFLHKGIWSNPESLRNLLIDEWEDEHITGAILIGDMPYATWELIHDTSTEPCPIPIFYEDLDATFADTDSNGRYDKRYWGDNDGPEIWVSNWFMPLMTIPSENLDPWGTGSTGGLNGWYYNDTSMSDLVSQRMDPLMDLNLNQSFLPPGVDADKFSIKWTGEIIANESEHVEFSLEVAGGARLYIDNTLLIDQRTGSTNTAINWEATKYLTKGSHDILLEYYKWDGGYLNNGSLFLGWDSPKIKIVNYNDYLKKTHLYHTGKLGQPEKGLLFMDYPYGYQSKMLEPIRDQLLYPLYGGSLVVGGGKNTTNAWEYLDYLEPGYELLSIWSHAGGRAHQFQPPSDTTYPYTGVYYADIRGMNGSTITLIWGCHAADFGDTGYVWSSDIDQNLAINYAFNTKYGLVSAGCTRSYGTTFRETFHALKNRSAIGDGYLAYKDYSYNRSLRIRTDPNIGLDMWIDDEALFGDPFVTSDHIPGDLSIVMNDGRKFVNDTRVTLHLYSNDPGEMSLRNEGGEWTDWVPFAPTMEWDLSIGFGFGKVYFRMRNGFGPGWTDASATVGYDTLPPEPVTVTINDGDTYTSISSIILNINVVDDLSGPEKVRTSRDGVSWSGWGEFSPSFSFDIGKGDGKKYVYIQVMDGAGHFSKVASSSIILDTVAPMTHLEVVGEEGENDWYTGGVMITLFTIEDDEVTTRFIQNGGPERSYSSPLLFLDSGDHELLYWSVDPAGNSEVPRSLEFRIDRESPQCMELVINDGDEYTASREIRLGIEAYDAISGCSKLCIRSDGSNWGDWIDLDPSVQYELEGQEGLNIVEVRIKDEAGNEMEQAIDGSIFLDMTPPGLMEMEPYPEQKNVPLDSWIVVNFNEGVLLDPLEGDPIAVYDDKGIRVRGTVDFCNLSTIASFEPNEPLEPFELYEVVLNSALKDRAGNLIGSDHLFNFTTVGVPPPGVKEVFIFFDNLNATVSWTHPVNEKNHPIEGFRVYRRDENTTLTIFEGGSEVNSCMDSTLEPGKVYFYCIIAFNRYGESERSPETSLKVPGLPGEEPPDDEPIDVDEEPIIDEDGEEKGGIFTSVIVSLAIFLLMAAVGGILTYIYIRKIKTIEKIHEDELDGPSDH